MPFLKIFNSRRVLKILKHKIKGNEEKQRYRFNTLYKI